MLIKIKKPLLVLSKFSVLFTVAVLTTGYSQTASAEVWADVRDNVITGNGVYDCTECHSYLKVIAGNSADASSRHSAPASANFDGATNLSAYNNVTQLSAFYGAAADPTYGFVDTTSDGVDNAKDRVYEWMADFVNTGYMPMDPTADVAPADGIPDDFTDAADLNPTKMASMLSWALQGAPYAAASATTSAASSISKVGATLNATTNANVHAGSAVLGTAYFEYGLTASYGTQTTAITSLSGTSGAARATAISGLTCSTLYNFRAVATNGSGTTNGSNLTFNTSSCTVPVITEGTSISPTATNEDTATTFTLNRSDDDPGTLTWSVFAQGSKGTFSFDTSTTGSPVTVRYTPTLNQNGADTAGRVRITNSATGLTATIIVNMDITVINDQGAITSAASTSAIEGVQYSYQVVNDDPDDSFGSGLSISLSNEPAGMTVGASTGLITWTPPNGVTSSGLITVTVSDGLENGTTAVIQQFTIAVTATNDPPVITPGATTTATEDVAYSYQMLVTDIDDSNNGADISFTLSGEPLGMSVSSTGLITWTPLEGVLTSGAVTMTVEDGNEDSSTPTIANNGQESFTISVTAVNDSAMITSTAITTGDEDVAYSYAVTATDVDDTGGFASSPSANQLQISLSGEPSGMVLDADTGIISWTPPRTGAEATYSNITVSVQDGLEDGAVQSDQMFDLTISIDDIDGDLVAVYSDNCPTVSNAAQADNDNDTVYVANAGFPAIGDVDQSDPLTGGDACDTDDDNDGMPDTFEDMFAFLDPFNAADAALDEDGDGLTNLEEYNNDNSGATIAVDSVGPTVNAPVDITINSTGLFTTVNLGAPTGNDGNEGQSTIFKAALDLAVAPTCTAFESYKSKISRFRPGSYVVTWITCDSKANVGSDTQNVNVKPLVSVKTGQSVGEGQAVSVDVVLNGDAISYPATVGYTLSGTAKSVDDHDGVDGVVSFSAKGEVGTIVFATLADAITESDETVVITLHTPDKIALSNRVQHTVTITEANVRPQAKLVVTQPGAALDVNKGSKVYQIDGATRVVADATDGNGDTLSFDWSATDANLLAAVGTTAVGNQLDFDPSVLTAGTFYKVSVTVSDGVTPVTSQRLLLVKATETNAWLITDDDDGDGVTNLAEGYGDDDADGIPNYRDNLSTPANAVEDQTVNLNKSVYIETDPGLKIAMGENAIAAQASGVLIGRENIIDFGGAGGVAVSNGATDYTFLSGLFSFEISGLTDATESVHVVIPLLSSIQANSVYRKYNSSGWFDFVEDAKNELRSASGSDGTCPGAGSSLYKAGLTAGHLCVQLTIQDGGANDADGERNYVVKDPGGLALAPVVVVAATPSQANGRVGSVSAWFMLCLSLAAVIAWRLRVQKVARVNSRA